MRLEMGLFKKFKKEDKKENNENSQGAESNIDIKTTDDIQNEQVKNECDNLQNEIRERNERLNTILEKIQISKKEYDEIVGKIIQSKKELHSSIIPKSDSETNNLLKSKNQDIDKKKSSRWIIFFKRLGLRSSIEIHKKNNPVINSFNRYFICFI